jgi:hypothetical protein
MMRATALLALHGIDVAISENLASSNEAGYDPADYVQTNSTGY